MAKSLDQFVKGNRKFLKIAEGETFTGTYLGYVIGPNRFDPEKEIVSYKLQPKDSDKPVVWNNGSTAVAVQMAKISQGEEIQITREGEGLKTKYTIATL